MGVGLILAGWWGALRGNHAAAHVLGPFQCAVYRVPMVAGAQAHQACCHKKTHARCAGLEERGARAQPFFRLVLLWAQVLHDGVDAPQA